MDTIPSPKSSATDNKPSPTLHTPIRAVLPIFSKILEFSYILIASAFESNWSAILLTVSVMLVNTAS